MTTFHRPGGITRRSLLATAGASVLGAHTLSFAQQRWTPPSPIKLIVPYAPGGGTDVLARIIAMQIGSALGQPIIVENRPGANGILGANLVHGAAPDGQTLLFAAADFISVAPHVYRKVVKYEPTDFSPIALIAKMGFVLASRQDNDAKELADVIIQARAKEITYAHWGPGSTSQMAMELLRSRAPGMKALPVPYPGAAPVMNAVMAGNVQYGFIPTPLAIASQSKLKLYAIASPQRFPAIKDIPTLTEKGYAVDADTWFGVLAPPKMPQGIVDTIRAEVVKASHDPQVRARMAEMGYTGTNLEPQNFGGFIKSEYERWGSVVRDANIRVDD